MRVLGIDCGTERTGFGVIESDGKTHRLVGAGVLVTSARQPLAARLLQIGRQLREEIARYQPDAAAVEEVFHAANAKSALKLAHARGVALEALAEAGVEIGEYSPLEVKMAVVGYGRAEKHQVQKMVKSLLGAGVDSEDACDALAVAICHATRRSTERRLEKVGA
ncbi:MAG: crossover junction endodeoxyribonuclease RuvC, partial [Bryobacteraceae bacterium]